MISTRKIADYEQCRSFVSGFFQDENYSDPMLATEEQVQNNLIQSIEEPNEHDAIGIYRNNELIGLFVFLTLKFENYLEMLVGLSREAEAYQEMFAYLEQSYAGYQADFVFNPNNHPLKSLLTDKNASFETEQQKMKFTSPAPDVDTAEIELLSEKYYKQYCAMHTQDVYWIGERIIASPERFRALIAVHDGQVVGYLDVTCCFEENEPFDLLVLEEYRRQGYGRKLLAKALELNHPNDMMLLVEIDNEPAISLYTSMGFEKVENQNNLTAHIKLA